MITLANVKQHLRIDFDDEDDYLNLLISVATEYVTGVTAVANDVDAPARYDLACLLLIAHWFANREAVVAGTMTNIPYGVPALLQHLRPVGDMF